MPQTYNSLNELEGEIKFLRSQFDANWLNKEIENIKKYYETKNNTRVLGRIENYANPLAYLIYQAETHLNRVKQYNVKNFSTEIIKAINLSMFLKKLQDTNVEGAKQKIKEISTAKTKNFEKLLFEMNIATNFVRGGHKVKFIKTQSDKKIKTPDILVDDCIEVECKQKDRLTKRDIKNNDNWEFLHRQLITFMQKIKRFYFIFIYFKTEPTMQIIKKVQKTLEKHLPKHTSGTFDEDDFKITFEQICTIDETFPLGISITNIDEFMGTIELKQMKDIFKNKIKNTDLLDYEKIQPDLYTDNMAISVQNNQVYVSQLMKSIFKTADPPDRIKGIISSIKSAKRQFSGQRCSIVVININNVAKYESDYRRLSEMINGIMRSNSTISGIVLFEEQQGTQGGITYKPNVVLIENKKAKFPLPQGFVFFGK